MFKVLKKNNIKVLITIDEVSNNQYMKQLALSFQMLLWEDYDLFILATGLYENISALENDNNMTFLIRAPKFYLCPLNLSKIASSYKQTLGLDEDESIKCAKMTKGYAFAFQLLGYLMFESKAKALDENLLAKYDSYLEEFAYNKIWSGLTQVEQKILTAVNSNNKVKIGTLLDNLNMKKEYFSQYRSRLIKKGIIDGSEHGFIIFTLARFNEFIKNKLLFEEF